MPAVKQYFVFRTAVSAQDASVHHTAPVTVAQALAHVTAGLLVPGVIRVSLTISLTLTVETAPAIMLAPELAVWTASARFVALVCSLYCCQCHYLFNTRPQRIFELLK